MRCYRRLDDTAAVAEADGLKAGALAAATKHDLVSVLQKRPFFARRQLDRRGARRHRLQPAAQLFAAGPGHRAASHQVARKEVAAVAAVVREHLEDRPV